MIIIISIAPYLIDKLGEHTVLYAIRYTVLLNHRNEYFQKTTTTKQQQQHIHHCYEYYQYRFSNAFLSSAGFNPPPRPPIPRVYSTLYGMETHSCQKIESFSSVRILSKPIRVKRSNLYLSASLNQSGGRTAIDVKGALDGGCHTRTSSLPPPPSYFSALVQDRLRRFLKTTSGTLRHLDSPRRISALDAVRVSPGDRRPLPDDAVQPK